MAETYTSKNYNNNGSANPTQVASPEYLKSKEYFTGQIAFHSKRGVIVPKRPVIPYIVNNTTNNSNSNTTTSTDFEKQEQEQEQEQQATNNKNKYNKTTATSNNNKELIKEKMNRLLESSSVQWELFGGFTKGDPHRAFSRALMTPDESRLKMRNRMCSRNEEETKFENIYEQQIYDIIFKPDHQSIESHRLMELIFEHVLVPIIHQRSRNKEVVAKQQHPLSIPIRDLLKMTNYHHYSSCLGSHCVLEKELSALPKSNPTLHNSFYHDEKFQVLAFSSSCSSSDSTRRTVGRIVSTKAECWIEWMKREQSNSVVELLFGTKNKKRNDIKIKSGFMEPALEKLLCVGVDYHVSKLRCDLLDKGYDFSEDLLTIVKV